MSNRPHWTKTDTGYRLDNGPTPATLHRVGKQVVCTVAGKEHVLPRKASFDHADAIVWAAVCTDDDDDDEDESMPEFLGEAGNGI